jgi:cell division protein FtsL
MLKLVNAVMVCSVLVAAFFLYRLEYSVRALERDIARTDKQTQDEREKIQLLTAEWASLTKPDRLQRIAEEQLHYHVLKAQQYVPLAELAAKLPPPPDSRPVADNADAIGDLLGKMHQ